MFKIKKSEGFSLVELLVALGAFAILASGVFYVVSSSYNNFYGTGDKQAVVEFAQEALEAVRAIRESSWQYLDTNTGVSLGLVQNNGVWSFSGTANTNGDLTRVVTISNVQRDSGGNIVASGGTTDPLTKKIVVTVSGAGLADYTLTSYLSSWANRSWEQTDWSGGVGTQYWSYDTKVYSSSTMDGVSTAGALKLAYTPGATTWGWEDITDFASTSMNGNSYCSLVDDVNNYWYLCGSGTTLWRLDITNIRSTGFPGSYTSITSQAAYTAALNPVYPHIYTGGVGGVIKSISTSTLATLSTYTPNTSVTTGIYATVVSSDGTQMFVGGNTGNLFSFSVDAGGALDCVNCTLWCDVIKDSKCTPADIPETFGAYNINAMWLDEANDWLYVVTDDPNYALIKINVANPADLVYMYDYNYTYDMVDMIYRGTNSSGANRFIVGLDYHNPGNEFMIIDDKPADSTFSIVAGVDLSAYYSKSTSVRDIEYTNNNQAYIISIHSAIPYIATTVVSGVDLSDSPSLSVSYSDNTTYGYYSIYYQPADYSNKFGGIFAGWTYAGSSTRRTTFIEQQEVASQGAYAATGNLVSSAVDLGSADQELYTLTINQNVPATCAADALEVTLQTDDNVSFTSPNSQVFSSSTVSTFTTDINASLNGQRWLRYQVDMSNCNSGVDTPSLYSLRLNYR